MRFVQRASKFVFASTASHFRSTRTRGLGLVLVGLVSAATCFGQTYEWKNVRIKGGGFVSGIITHPNAPGVVYARTDIGGAYRWDPATSSWIPLLDFAADANLLGVESIAIDPSDSNRLYIASSRGSPAVLLVSTNQGASFSQFTPPFSLDGNARGRGDGERLDVDPNLGSVLFYGTKSAGLYQSVNYGATWGKVASFPGSTTTNGVGTVFVQFIAGSGTPGSATPVIFAAVSQTNNPIYRSPDGGVTWSNVPIPAAANFMPHHASQDGLGNMYITFNDTCGPNDNVATGAVVKLNLTTLTSTDVTPPKNPGEQGGWGGVSVDLQNPTTVMVSTLDRWWPPPYDQVYRSTNGGASWKTTAGANPPPPGNAPWTIARTPHWAEAMQVDPFNSDRAWFGTGYGIFSCTNLTAADSNGTVDWEFTSDGIEEMVPLGLASPPSGPYLLSAHGDQGGYRHYDLDVSPPAADYFSTHRETSYGIDFAENNPNYIVRLVSSTNYGAYCIDGGTVWHDFATFPPGTGSNPGNIAISADGKKIVWMPSSGSAVAYWSTNFGNTWTAATGGPTGARVPISDRVNTNKFYIYTSSSGGRMYVSTNGGVSFSAAASVSGGATPRTVFGHEGDIWLPRGGSGLAHSTDSGATFATVVGVTSASFVSFGKAAPSQSYPAVFISGTVGGVAGVYRSDDAGATWVQINDSQHQFGLGSIHTFCADPRVYGRVYFGTEGRGVVYGQFAAPSLVPPLLTFTMAGSQVQIGWPQDHTGWILQAQTNVPGDGLTTNWGTVPGSSATNLMTLPVDTTDGSVFYRLISP